jgi:hypothetical protein
MQAKISGAFSGASWAVFPARFFQGPVKQLVFQIFGAQPALAVAERATRNIVEGKPATEGLGEAYGQGVVGTLTPALGHTMVKWALPTRAPAGGGGQPARTSVGARGPAATLERSSPTAQPPRFAEGGQRPTEPITPPFKEGSFSFSDWTGYPDNASKPKGPFRLRQGEEYDTARDAADRVNKKTRSADPARYAGMEIHEVHPVKFGGHPTDPANKIVLPVKQHRLLNIWWYRRQRSLERGMSK